jgi:hypothetical protein
MTAKGESDDFLKKKRERPAEVKGWFCTWPRCDLELQTALDKLLLKTKDNIEEYLIAREHHEDGGIHLHAFLKLKRKRYFKEDMFDIDSFHGHYEPCKSYKAVQIYCTKENDYISNFALEEGVGDSKQRKRAKKNKRLLTGDIDEMLDNGEISVMSVPTIVKARQLLAMNKKPSKMIERKCYWIYGKPRIGKSYLVREIFDPYEKQLNKWWDGYTDQEIVLIDDIDDKGKCLAHYMKIWADNYRFLGEIKCGTIYPTYKCLIVTSNYLPYQIWDDDKILSEAIESRFEMIEMTERAEQKSIQERILGELGMSGEVHEDVENGVEKNGLSDLE